jgi:hypothetical protein
VDSVHWHRDGRYGWIFRAGHAPIRPATGQARARPERKHRIDAALHHGGCKISQSFGQICPSRNFTKDFGMGKRDSFLAELREEAKAKGLSFESLKRRGKGSHALVRVGERWTTVPDREIDPKTASKIRKNLGLV